MKKILFCNPRGPCAGVDRALDIVEHALQKYGAPIFVNHQIVHNEFVIEEFEKQGVIFCKQPEEIPQHSVYIYSAHGVSPDLKKRAKERNLEIIDATCPLVTKVHHEAQVFKKKKKKVLYIGHKNHPEALGVMGIDDMILVENTEQVETLVLSNEEQENLTLLTQTTLSIDDTSKIIEALEKRFPAITTPKVKDICYATTNRQEAVKNIAHQADVILVVGSEKSSNSKRLVEVAKKEGCESYLIPSIQKILEILPQLSGKNIIGLTSGASVPEALTQKILREIQQKNPEISVEEISGRKETVVFPRGF